MVVFENPIIKRKDVIAQNNPNLLLTQSAIKYAIINSRIKAIIVFIKEFLNYYLLVLNYLFFHKMGIHINWFVRSVI